MSIVFRYIYFLNSLQQNVCSDAFCVCAQYRAALLSLMVDTAVMLGAPQKAARVQMEKALDFETKLAHVKKAFAHKYMKRGPNGTTKDMFCFLLPQIIIPYENRTSENMYNRYTLSRLQRQLPQVFSFISLCCVLCGVVVNLSPLYCKDCGASFEK